MIINYKIPFYSNTPDNMHCVQASMKMVWEYFLPKNIYVAADKTQILNQVLAKYTNKTIYLVDDKLDILYLAKRIWPTLKSVWVKRGKYALGQNPIKDFTPDLTIPNLKPIISKLDSKV